MPDMLESKAAELRGWHGWSAAKRNFGAKIELSLICDGLPEAKARKGPLSLLEPHKAYGSNIEIPSWLFLLKPFKFNPL